MHPTSMRNKVKYGVFQDPFAKTVVYIFERIGMDELEAIRVYRLIFVQNKTMIIGAGFFVLLFCHL